jgi:Transposase IS116/IS110/IS902 family/DDE superfamily endonuclease
MTAVAAIDDDMRRMVKASGACRRLMTIPGVGQLTALAFVAAIDDPSRIRRSRDVGAYLGLVPKRYQFGEADYVGGISKCGDRRVRTLLYEAANVPDNITPIFLPSRAPELNPVENVWQYLRQNWLSNTVFENYDAIIDAACDAWRKPTADPERITSIGGRD